MMSGLRRLMRRIFGGSIDRFLHIVHVSSPCGVDFARLWGFTYLSVIDSLDGCFREGYFMLRVSFRDLQTQS